MLPSPRAVLTAATPFTKLWLVLSQAQILDWVCCAMQTCATHPKTARREEKSDKKKEERIGAQLVAEIMGPHPDTATFAISDPTWRPSSSHLQPTWASQPRNCGGHDGRDDARVPPVDLTALVQLTAWVEQLDGIMRMNNGEDEVILRIRARAVGVLDSWVGRWEVMQGVQKSNRFTYAKERSPALAPGP